MMDQVDFIEKHQKLRESADRVLGLSQSQRDFKDNTTILIYGGAYDYLNAPKYLTTEKCMKKDPFVKKLNYTIRALDKFILSRTRKLLQSSSKQPRIISVVCK